MHILFIGDVFGRPGRLSVSHWLPELREEYEVDFVVANGENAAGGLGATPDTIEALQETGVDVITLGNHTWRKRELVRHMDTLRHVVRPANYPPGVPGEGVCIRESANGIRVAVLNLVGRVFMDPVDCPFRTAEAMADELAARAQVVLVDMHAEASAEKVAMGWFLDGRCAAVIGTHTHVQTADERVLPGGTAYITDVGMTGPMDSVIGVERERIINRFLTGMPTEFKVSKERPGLCAAVIDVDEKTGLARSIERIQRVKEDL